ncbi:MAG TPA: CpsD/CapB family tyrosine-protein kinase [Vicinamibacteria bacterium]
MTLFDATPDKVFVHDAIDLIDRTADRASVGEPALAAAITPGSPMAEQFRVLAARVKAIAAERAFQCIGILSAAAGEGRTTVAFGLAAALAEEHRRVLLVEACLREPGLVASLGLPSNGGLSQWLRGDGLRPVSVRRVEPWGVRLLPAGPRVGQPADLLGSDRMAKLLDAARRGFDFVIVDCPPLAPLADALLLQNLLEGALLVVRARHTFRDAIARAHESLKPNLVQGVVFNDHREILTRHLNQNGRRRKA